MQRSTKDLNRQIRRKHLRDRNRHSRWRGRGRGRGDSLNASDSSQIANEVVDSNVVSDVKNEDNVEKYEEQKEEDENESEEEEEYIMPSEKIREPPDSKQYPTKNETRPMYEQEYDVVFLNNNEIVKKDGQNKDHQTNLSGGSEEIKNLEDWLDEII